MAPRVGVNHQHITCVRMCLTSLSLTSLLDLPLLPVNIFQSLPVRIISHQFISQLPDLALLLQVDIFPSFQLKLLFLFLWCQPPTTIT